LCLLCGDYNSAPKLTGPRRAIAVTASVLAYAALIIVAIAIVVFGWAGEVLSIQALYNHGPAGKPTLWAVIVLTAAVVIPPFLRFARDRMELPKKTARKTNEPLVNPAEAGKTGAAKRQE
jgi:hypothetical protein